MKEKTLYFEAVGAVSDAYNGISCRIRTAFTNNAGEKIYLEIYGCHPNKQMVKNAHQYFLDKKDIPKAYLHIASAYVITEEGNDDECKKRLSPMTVAESVQTSYTEENILNVVNRYFNCTFDKICIPNAFAGYRVFKEQKKRVSAFEHYNYGDEFSYDEALTLKMMKKVSEMKKHFEKVFSQKYDNTSYWNEKGKLMVQLNVSEEKRLAAGYAERRFVVEV